MSKAQERARHVVVVGGGRVGQAVARRLPADWRVVVIDPDPNIAEAVRVARPGAELIQGDATSRLVLQRARLDERSVLIAATGDDAVNQEAARLAREVYGTQERVVLGREPATPESGVLQAELLDPTEALAGRVVNRVSVAASVAVDVGLGVGELVQVTVLEGSAATGRNLRDLGARNWLIAAVYRENALIVPHGDTRLMAGDRVLLVGEPEVLREVGPYIRGGAAVFPSQYGNTVAFATPADEGMARGLASRVSAEEVRALDLQACANAEGVGCLVMPATPVPWYARLGLTRSQLHSDIVNANRPVFLRRGEGPFSRILLAVRDVELQREVVMVSVDLARQLGATLSALTVGPGDPDAAAKLDRLGRLHDLDIQHRRATGNPVHAIRAAAASTDLLVVGLRPEHNSPLSPDISTHLLADCPCTLLVVPWGSR